MSPPTATRGLAALLIVFVLGGCAAPIGIKRVSPHDAQISLTQFYLTNERLSEKAQILLRRANQEEAWKDDPEAVLSHFHEALRQPVTAFNAELRASLLDAVAELAFAHASASKDRRYYLAAALYAWLYLFPDDPSLQPSPVDRGVAAATNLYNRGITLGITDHETGEVLPQDELIELPFGKLSLDLDESTLEWGNRRLTRFVSLADIEVRGINNRYRISGLGAPLAAGIEPLDPNTDAEARTPESDLIFENVRVPISLIMEFTDVEAGLETGEYAADLSIIAFSSATTAEIQGQEIPIEAEPTAALALLLAEDPPWWREIKGFFQGDLGLGRPGLVSLAPYQEGLIPVVLVHGTASSAGRWADLLNDLSADTVLRRRFQFWLFTYNSGNPIAYSGWLLRRAIGDLIESLDPEGRDAALKDLVVMGHSQGGLLTKLLVVDSGTKFWDLVVEEPPDQVELEPENRELLEGSLLLEPSPYVKRVIFLSTPHRGSVLATLGPARLLGRAVRAPANLVNATSELFSEDPETEVRQRLKRSGGAIGNMSPGSPFVVELAALPIAPGIHAHSIIGIKKEPKETSGDGVVSYESAHLDGVDSELVITSGHSSQANPLVVGEVRRILLEHLAEAIEAGRAPPFSIGGQN